MQAWPSRQSSWFAFPVMTVLVLLGGAGWSAETAPRPNIVYLLADDPGWEDVGFHGGEIKTPQLDKLAETGAKLEQFYVQSVCTPTRAALLTGRYPIRHGLQVGVVRPWAQYGLPLAERTLPQALQEAGYETAITGKWHLGHFRPEYLPTKRGFDHQYGHYNGAIDYFTHIRDAGLDWHRDDTAEREEGYSTHLIARAAVRRVREHDVTKPLFLYVPFNAVHAPHQVPAKYSEPYARFSEPRRTCAGMVAALANWPGHIPSGSVVNQPMHVVDWCPTLLRLAGASLQQPLPVDGRDAWETIVSGRPSPHDEILLNATPLAGAIRRGDWKLVINGTREHNDGRDPATGRAVGWNAEQADAVERVELFNIALDPSEKTNPAESQPEKVKEPRARYDAYASQAVSPKVALAAPAFRSPKVWGESE